jgi:hypothetical protein
MAMFLCGRGSLTLNVKPPIHRKGFNTVDIKLAKMKLLNVRGNVNAIQKRLKHLKRGYFKRSAPPCDMTAPTHSP